MYASPAPVYYPPTPLHQTAQVAPVYPTTTPNNVNGSDSGATPEVSSSGSSPSQNNNSDESQETAEPEA